jgi:hypothetical protein
MASGGRRYRSRLASVLCVRRPVSHVSLGLALLSECTAHESRCVLRGCIAATKRGTMLFQGRSGDGVLVNFELPFQIAADAIRSALVPLTSKNWPPGE